MTRAALGTLAGVGPHRAGHLLVGHTVLLADPPATRDSARAAAHTELAKPAYHRNDPSWAQRALSWLYHQLARLLSAAARHAPGHNWGLAAIALLLVVVVVVVAVGLGRPRGRGVVDSPLLDATARRPADHRARAEELHAAQHYAEAIREWLRAISRELEERGVLDPRPGRTADELCAEASAQLPGIAADLRRATAIFDGVWYGRRPAGPDDEQLLRALDARVAGSHRELGPTHNAVLPAGGRST